MIPWPRNVIFLGLILLFEVCMSQQYPPRRRDPRDQRRKQEPTTRPQQVTSHPVQPTTRQPAPLPIVDLTLANARANHTPEATTSRTPSPVDDDDEDEPDYQEEDEYSQRSDPEEYTAESYLQCHMVPLPSGKSIRLRPYSLISALHRGELPNTLVAPARKLLYGDEAPKPRDHRRPQQPHQDDEDMKSGAAMTDWLCCQMIASFACVDKPQGDCMRGEVSVWNILECDKIAITQFAMQGQAALNSFRH